MITGLNTTKICGPAKLSCINIARGKNCSFPDSTNRKIQTIIFNENVIYDK